MLELLLLFLGLTNMIMINIQRIFTIFIKNSIIEILKQGSQMETTRRVLSFVAEILSPSFTQLRR